MIYLVCSSDFDACSDDVVRLELLSIEFLKVDLSLSDFDAIIVSSKNAIKSLAFNNIKPVEVPLYAISDKTAQSAKDFGFTQVINTNSKDQAQMAEFLAPRLLGKKALYLRAKQVAGDLAASLAKAGVRLSQCVCYQSKHSQNLPKIEQDSAIFIFASALNFKAFYSLYGWQDGWRGVAIGTSTAKALSQKGINAITSQIPSIANCIELARKIKANS